MDIAERAPSASDSGNMQEGRIASFLQGAFGRDELRIAAPPRRIIQIVAGINFSCLDNDSCTH